MNSQEKSFLDAMNGVWDIVDCWRTKGGIRQLRDGHTFQYDTPGIISSVEHNLKWAGTILGLNARFKVEASKQDWRLVIHTKNGHANLMMERYRQLYTEWELNDECGQG
jgi:hypothetical protein